MRFIALAAAFLAAPAAPLLASEPTMCDTLAAHPDDPHRLGPGVESEEMDRRAALAACLGAVDRDPLDPRAQYQLGRVWFYLGRPEEGLPHLRVASDYGYPQATFVLGYVYATGFEGVAVDECRAGGLWLRAAAMDHPWSAWHLVNRTIEGRFDTCDLKPSMADLDAWMNLSREMISPEASAGRVEDLGERYRLWKDAQ